MAVLLLALLGASLGGEVYRDGLRGGPPLLAAEWTPLRGQWEAVDAGLVGGPDESLALLHAVPPLTEGRVAVTVTPRQRVRRDGWAVAGLLLRESAERFWQLGLVADPDHKTYRMELLEAYDGTWQAQHQGATQVQGTVAGDGRWEYARPYRMELRWTATRVVARVLGPEGEREVWSASFELPGATPAVRMGQPVLKADGLMAEFRDLEVDGVPAAGRRVVGRGAVLLDGDGPWKDAAWTAATAALGKLLATAGYTVRTAAPGDLTLDPERDGLVAAASLERLPRRAAEALLDFVQQGGDLVASGGEPFAQVLYRTDDGRWVPRGELLAAVTPRASVLEPATARGLVRGTNQPTPAPVITPGAMGPSGQTDGLLVQIPGLTGWDTLTAPFGASPFAAGDSLTVVDVRGTPGEAITLEWKEQDGSRWIARVPLATSWTRHVLEPTDFEFWPDGSPATRAGGHLNPQAVRALSFGPAVGHGATRGKAIEYALGPVGVGPSPLADRSWVQPHLETLSPWYKQAVTTIDKRAVRVPIPRQRGLTAAAEMDGRYLALGNLLKPFASRYATVAGAALVWLPDATLGAKESEQVADLLRRGGEGIFVLNSGPRAVVLDPSQPVELAARLTHGGAAAADLQVNWQVFQGSKAVREHSAALTLQPGAMRGVTAPNPAPLPAGDYRLQTSVTLAGKLVDVAETHLRVVVPTTPSGQRVTVEGGRFAVDGKRLFLHGVNFWPRYVSGQERDRYWSHWLSPRNYDPEVVEADLKAVAGLGMNLVSVQYNALDQAPAMRDLLARARRHGLWVNVYLGGAHPLSFDPLLVSRLLTEGRLCGDPTVFAYDLAWEPRLGVHQERRRYDAAWRAWLDEQYGSLAAAEVAWGTAAPREAGQATNPLDEQITSDGPHRTMVAAYRRFVDDLVSRGYRRVVQYIQRLDPEALLGARTGYGGTGQPGANRVMAYDLLAGAAWLSFTSPEGYGLPPTFEEGRRTGLVTHYGRWAGNGAPVFWSEFGASLGPRGGTPETRQRQEGIWETMLRVISDSDADASAGWWWPGGWRIDERSDYGVMAPDGSIRESARIGARLAKRIQESGNDAGRGEPVQLSIDRDADARGLTGLLERTAEGYLKARAEGRPVRLVTAGSGTTTATMPLVQVGNVPYQGTGPLKYANAEIEGVRAEWPGGSAEANTGDTIAVPAGAVCRLIARLRNTGEAAWLNSSGRGACRLETTHGAAAITAGTARYASVSTAPLAVTVTAPLTIEGRLAAADIGAFGEPLRLKLVPAR